MKAVHPAYTGANSPTLKAYIEEQRVTINAGFPVMVSAASIFAPAMGKEKAMWLAHILNVLSIGTEFEGRYEFHDVPDVMINTVGNPKNLYHVVVIDTLKEGTAKIVGYAEPAERQPLLSKYLESYPEVT